MTDYFDLSPTMTGDAKRLAFVGAHRGLLFREVMRRPGPVEDPPTLSWTWALAERLPDWVPTVDSLPAFSPRMADVVRDHLGPRDQIQWLNGVVINSDAQHLPQEIPHFLDYPDLYDEDATTWGPSGLPIRWVLSRPKLHGLRFFARYGSSGSILVDTTMLRALQSAGLTGFTTRPARITD